VTCLLFLGWRRLLTSFGTSDGVRRVVRMSLDGPSDRTEAACAGRLRSRSPHLHVDHGPDNDSTSGATKAPERIISPDDLLQIAAAAKAARKARNSLRGYLATLAAAKGKVEATRVRPESFDPCSAARERAARDFEELNRHPLPSQALLPLPDSSNRAAHSVSFQSLQTLQQSLQQPATAVGGQDFAPRLRLRLGCSRSLPRDLPLGGAFSGSPTLPHRGQVSSVLAVALQEEESTGDEFAQGRVAIVLNTGRVEVWQRDPFGWHHAAASTAGQDRLSQQMASQASAVLSADRGADSHVSLWIALMAAKEFVVLLFESGSVAGIGAGPLLQPVAVYLQEASPTSTLMPKLSELAAFKIDSDYPKVGVCFAVSSDCTDEATVGRALTWHSPASINANAGDEAQAVGELQEAAVFPIVSRFGPSPPTSKQVAAVWPLRMGDIDDLNDVRFAVWLRHEPGLASDPKSSSGGELQIWSALGQCLAVSPTSARCLTIAVLPPPRWLPPQPLQTVGPTFIVAVLLASDTCPTQAEWTIALAAPVPNTLAAADGRPALQQLELRRLRTPRRIVVDGAIVNRPTSSFLDVAAVSSTLVCCRPTESEPAHLLDWGNLRVHTLPTGWTPVAAGRSVIICRASGIDCEDELVFFEQS